MVNLIAYLCRSSRGFRQNQRGAMSVELALIGSALFFAALPLSDLISSVYNSQQLVSATRAAMNYALKHPDDTAGIEGAAQNNAGSMDTEKMSVSTSTFCECGGSSYSCNNVCAYGMQEYLTVSATYTQTLMIDYPGYGQEVPITKELTVRTE